MCIFGVIGHWIVFLIYPQDGRAIIFDSLQKTKQRRLQEFWNLSTIVSDDRFFYALKSYIKFVVDTSGWHTALIGNTSKTPNAMIGGRRRGRSGAQNCQWGGNSRYVWRTICATTSLMLCLCVLMTMCYIYHAWSAPSNLKAQSCMNTMLVSTSGHADVSTTANINSKSLKIGGERKGSTVEASLKQ